MVITVLINFHIGAGFEEIREIVISFCFLVEVYDVLHEFLVLVPVCSLQEVGCKDVCLGASCVVGKTDDFRRVSKLDQALKRGDFITHFDVKVGGHFEAALLAAFLCNDSG